MAETTIRSEMRQVDGKPEIMVNLSDVLTWLTELPELSSHPAGGQAALEIRQLLITAVDNAELVTKQ
jgi:hypothetical protein